MKKVSVWMFLFSMLLATGCAPTTKYAWNNYDQKLYDHYKNPAEYEQFVEDLKNTIEEGDESGRVPPGIYAEYGFVLYESGKTQESLLYFQKEHDKWPESRILMTKMTANAQKQTNKNKKPITIEALPVQTQGAPQ
ncbi:MAG TPA: DUF4810 domain-containing protein [Desulfuromonadales bacterium]|nr:DUF4810 domain-containing protein [Desulfuromonadales bacterium]